MIRQYFDPTPRATIDKLIDQYPQILHVDYAINFEFDLELQRIDNLLIKSVKIAQRNLQTSCLSLLFIFICRLKWFFCPNLHFILIIQYNFNINKKYIFKNIYVYFNSNKKSVIMKIWYI